MTATFIHPVTAFIEKTFVITEFELRKLRHDFTELITRALQPALWMLIFGHVFSRSGAMHTGNIPYLDFIAPGILAQSVLFVAIFYGIISHLNPLTCVVEALRTFMLADSTSTFGSGLDYAVIFLTTMLLVFIGARLYPRLAV
jgi:ABC-2 type transport system permease protein